MYAQQTMTVVLGFLNTVAMVEKFDKFDKSDWIRQRLTDKHILNKCLYKAFMSNMSNNSWSTLYHQNVKWSKNFLIYSTLIIMNCGEASRELLSTLI